MVYLTLSQAICNRLAANEGQGADDKNHRHLGCPLAYHHCFAKRQVPSAALFYSREFAPAAAVRCRSRAPARWHCLPSYPRSAPILPSMPVASKFCRQREFCVIPPGEIAQDVHGLCVPLGGSAAGKRATANGKTRGGSAANSTDISQSLRCRTMEP